MKAPLGWLREYVTFTTPLGEMADLLARSGCEVDRITQRGAPDTGANHDHFRIGRVVSQEPHPHADRLRLCQVDVGEPDTRQIVCGATNFEAGDTVVVALPGARLSTTSEPLRRAKLRGEASDGMMLSERELELSAEHDGIIVLPDEYEPGALVRDHVALWDTILELEPTTNRPDLLSMYGVAREIAALLDAALAPMPGNAPPAHGERAGSSLARVGIDAPERCYRFTARAFERVSIARSPLHVRQRVAACGMRPITNVVDITNYVMLGLGNPTHAYDADTIKGGELRARLARPGEDIVTLDGRRRALTDDILVIADAEGPAGVAGVMGGADSEVTDTTTQVVVEVANFERSGIQRACVQLALRTDGSTRWTRGVDPHLAPHASAWAAELLVRHAGAVMLPSDQDVIAYLPERERIILRDGRAERVLGMPIDAAESEAILRRLGYEPRRVDGGIEARVPTWRWLDTTREIDLVEEVGRMDGLERLPATMPRRSDGGGHFTPSQRLRRLVEDALVGIGLWEAVTVSLIDAAEPDQFGMVASDERRFMIPIRNPISHQHAYLRRTLIPSLLRALRRNHHAGRTDVALFEIAHLYHAAGGVVEAERLAREPWTLGIVLAGRLGGTSWTGGGAVTDFFAAKGVLATLAARLGIDLRLEQHQQPYLHPGRAARILLAGAGVLGEIGELHPAAAGRFGVEGRVSVIELDLDQVAAHLRDRFDYQPVVSHPPIRQDIAIVLADDVRSSDVIAAALAAGAPLLARADVFDVYRDANRLGSGRHSLALRLTFQDPERTLTEAEASAVRSRVVDALTAEFEAELRI